MDRESRPGERPLTGVRVLDFTRVLSGPHATRMLCDLGADVIKVEPPAGDMTRFANPRVNSLSTYFVQQNTGKRNISLDMERPAARELLLQLAAHCDVVVENFRPGVMDRMGLGHAAIAARNPRVVFASISGYGQTGPWVRRRAYAPVVGAETGITRSQGDARGASDGHAHYANDPHSHADVYTSLECATAVLAALYQRERTGRGDRIDISMAQTMLYVNEHAHDDLWDGAVQPDWIRSFQPGDYPVLTAANGETAVISGHPCERGTFDRYVAAMGRTDLIADPRFADVPSRLAHFDELLDLMRSWARTVPDPHAIEDLLEEIVGEIQDEYDEEEPLIEHLDPDRVRVDGRASIDDLLDLWDMKVTLEDEDEYDTVGGFVYHRIGGVPSPGDEIRFSGLRLTVETTDGRRVGKVLVVRERSADDESAGDEG